MHMQVVHSASSFSPLAPNHYIQITLREGPEMKLVALVLLLTASLKTAPALNSFINYVLPRAAVDSTDLAGPTTGQACAVSHCTWTKVHFSRLFSRATWLQDACDASGSSTYSYFIAASRGFPSGCQCSNNQPAANQFTSTVSPENIMTCRVGTDYQAFRLKTGSRFDICSNGGGGELVIRQSLFSDAIA